MEVVRPTTYMEVVQDKQGALRASNWLFMVVGVLMAMTILQILEVERVKMSFS
ncbi:hypothetical protein YC2023_121519 [Brassica napus]